MSEPDQPNRHTIDADEATLEEMRRFAEQARRQAAAGSVDDDRTATNGDTIEADDELMAKVQRHVEDARRSSGVSKGEVTIPVPDDVAVTVEADAVTDKVTDVVTVAEPAPEPMVPARQRDTQSRASVLEPLPVPPDLPGGRWQPPPRTVLPAARLVTVESRSPGLWKPIAIVLAVVVVVLVALLLFGGSSGDDQPGGSTVPGSTPAPVSEPASITTDAVSDDG